MKNGFILKNSFDSIVMRHNLMRNEDFETIEQCVSVADNYAVEFGEYLDSLTAADMGNKSIKEILQIFKKENNYDTRRKN